MAVMGINLSKIIETVKKELNEANTLKLEPYSGSLAGVDGWLSPSGTFYACSYHDHLVYADKLSDKMGYKRVNKFPFQLNGEYTLEKMGWIKISLSRVVVYKGMTITKKQLDFLFDYYVSNSKKDEFMEIFEMYEDN
ncbi:MAG: hypothetical protein M1609_14400 [Firmicutes bacterium]|nr:hypothetical protein [Bacillota bacterium]